MSFMLTQDQIRNRSKTVTRRLGWANLKPGDRLQACLKCQGLKKGEKVQKLAVIEIVSNTKEQLHRMIHNRFYGDSESAKEGFPDLVGPQFVAMFCKAMNCDSKQIVNRIEFKYVKEESNEQTTGADELNKVSDSIGVAQRKAKSAKRKAIGATSGVDGGTGPEAS
jgi:hypothetical protein